MTDASPIVLFTSPCGVGSREFLTRLARKLPGIRTRYLDDDMLRSIGDGNWYEAHSRSADRICQAWVAAFHSLPVDGEPILAHTHLIHYNDDLQLFFPVADPAAVLKTSRVRAVVCLCDDVYETLTEARYLGLYKNIEDPADPNERRERYVDAIDTVLLWRRLDLISAEGFARALGVPHYLVAVRHAASNIANLLRAITEAKRPRSLYLSHHIREICNSGAEWKRDARLINVVAETTSPFGVTVFEPTTIDEFIVTYDGQARVRWPRNYDDGCAYTFNESLEDCLSPLGLTQDGLRADLGRTMRQIDRDVTWRDLRLVYQSAGFLMWRPFWRGKVSTGAMRELQVFAQRDDEGQAILVHQVGDVTSWLTDVIRRKVTESGGTEKSPGFGEAVKLLEAGFLQGKIEWLAVLSAIARGISARTTRRAPLTAGGTKAGHQLQTRKDEIAARAVKLIRESTEVFSCVEALQGNGRLQQFVEPNLDDEASIKTFIMSKLQSALVR